MGSLDLVTDRSEHALGLAGDALRLVRAALAQEDARANDLRHRAPAVVTHLRRADDRAVREITGLGDVTLLVVDRRERLANVELEARVGDPLEELERALVARDRRVEVPGVIVRDSDTHEPLGRELQLVRARG